MDILDELMTSFDDTLSASSPQHMQQEELDQSQNHSLQNDSPNSQDMTWRLTNSVHMELQENARVPTFGINVDRTGSSNVSARHLQAPFLSTDSLEHELRPNNLGEAFLGSGRHARYANAGAQYSVPTTTNYNELNPSTGGIRPPVLLHNAHGSDASFRKELAAVADPRTRSRGDSMEQLFDYQMMDAIEYPVQDEKKDTLPCDPLLDALVDPTPLDEIRKRQEMARRHLGQRQTQLPIPMTGKEDLTLAAHATANALAAVDYAQRDQRGDLLQQSAASPTLVAVSQTPQAHLSSFGQMGQTHSSIPASIERASQQKSQYGFGRKHKVPSVP